MPVLLVRTNLQLGKKENAKKFENLMQNEETITSDVKKVAKTFAKNKGMTRGKSENMGEW